ncbi:Endonuclease/exonuclease/phosphatase [Parasponia andersonii]|uniref:Endonuclease/exonuclease/phosphatase n=1 Tax=Parasponia andersonii TaxID=3476 RepID=A0A2P5CTW3_PARAD|nr:Endonuclease/exonuclease/phosphatase [Parasponia andersonii]
MGNKGAVSQQKFRKAKILKLHGLSLSPKHAKFFKAPSPRKLRNPALPRLMTRSSGAETLSSGPKRKILEELENEKTSEKKQKITEALNSTHALAGPMSCICWNVPELGNPCKVTVLCNLLRKFSPGLVFLSETKLFGIWATNLKYQVGFKNCFVVDCVRRSDSLILLWRDD